MDTSTAEWRGEEDDVGHKNDPRGWARCVWLIIPVMMVGCAAQPRQRPIRTSPINTGAGSVSEVRRQLAGNWDLVSYETFDSEGQATTVPASGRVMCDEFGNIELIGQLDRGTADTRTAELLNARGRLAIDVQMQRFLVLDLEGNLPLGQDEFENAPADRFRYYEFDGSDLILTIRDESERIAALVTYRRQ